MTAADVAPTAAPAKGEMKPTLGLMSATTLIVGSAIGSGIFLLPAVMAGQLQAPGLLLLVWLLGGVFSLFGALTFAEMGAMFPRAGGIYVFLREAFGERIGFLYGWTFFWVINTGIIAAVAYAFATYLGVVAASMGWGAFDTFTVKVVAVGCILLLSLVNYLGVKYGGILQNVFTVAKVAAIFALVGVVFYKAPGTGQILTPFLPADLGAGALAGAVAGAMVAALFAYDGWASTASIASEVKNPQRTVPVSMLLGVLIVMAVYLAAVMAYLHAFTITEVAKAPALASNIMESLQVPNGALLIALAIVISTFGTVNAFVLAGPRTYYAQAREGVSYPGMASLSPRFGTPDFGLLIQAEWAALLVLTGSYKALVNFATIGIILFYAVATVGFFRLRVTQPDTPRPYRAIGYPVIPALFLLGALFIVGTVTYTDWGNTWPGLLLIASGFPMYELLRWNQARRTVRVPITTPAGAPLAGEPVQPTEAAEPGQSAGNTRP